MTESRLNAPTDPTSEHTGTGTFSPSDVKPSHYGATTWTAALGVAVWYFAMWTLLQRMIFLGNYTSYLPTALRRFFPLAPLDAEFKGEQAAFVPALLQNTLLFLLYAVPTAIMSRKSYKRWATTNFYPKAIERSTMILVWSLTQTLLMRNWVPMPHTTLTMPSVLSLLPLLGYAIELAATINVDHLSFFGLKQAIGLAHEPHFVQSGLYRFVRHPLFVGELIQFRGYPVLTRGRLLMALLNTVYLVVRATVLEEPDMITAFGERYKEYMRKVPGFLPWMRTGKAVQTGNPVEATKQVVEEVARGTKLE